ncbi:5-formyltetrahydrofolate cyclo-ligase [Candidatus Rickettsia colombianensi]|uniref:5-formyltetrahydrofolate cyclo-ligase n=1 Tax=Candidatus Rickettsia colombianensi TaxID=1090944 RepID=UPI000EF1C931|nr:5-formyltetrahydrofolate cyclo-ligase [Candidatus Rickettsia colombianensi]
MNKQELRLYFKELLIKNQEKITSDLVKNSLINKISRLLQELKVKTAGLYFPLKYEINLLEITNLHPKIKFFLPKIIKNKIKYCPYHYNDQLALGAFKTYEPINNDFFIPELVIIPGLAFSKEGYRLGYGKGHFDRYLNNNRNILTAGVCLKEQLIDNLLVESHDRKLNFVISV